MDTLSGGDDAGGRQADLLRRGAAARPPVSLCTPRTPARQTCARSRPARSTSSAAARAEVGPAKPRAPGGGTPQGCADAIANGAFTPNQLSTAYGVDALHDRGLQGTESASPRSARRRSTHPAFTTWAQCFGLATPEVQQFAMPGASRRHGDGARGDRARRRSARVAGARTRTDHADLRPARPELHHSFVLFMFGALDPSRQGGPLPDRCSRSATASARAASPRTSCSSDERLLAQAAALGITTLAASGDSVSRAATPISRGRCSRAARRSRPASAEPTSTLTPGTRSPTRSSGRRSPPPKPIRGSAPAAARARSGRPGFQRRPGVAPRLQPGKSDPAQSRHRLDGVVRPGLADLRQGRRRLGDRRRHQRRDTADRRDRRARARAGARRRPARLGSLPPLLYEFARGPGYSSIFYDITNGTSSHKPTSPAGQSPPAAPPSPATTSQPASAR